MGWICLIEKENDQRFVSFPFLGNSIDGQLPRFHGNPKSFSLFLFFSMFAFDRPKNFAFLIFLLGSNGNIGKRRVRMVFWQNKFWEIITFSKLALSVQFPANFFTFTKEILEKKFSCSGYCWYCDHYPFLLTRFHC